MPFSQPSMQRPRSNMGLLVFIGVGLFFMFFWRLIGLATDWFWFQEVGYQTIFTTTFLSQLKTAAIFGIGFFLIFYGNLHLAVRLSAKARIVLDHANPLNIPALQLGNRTWHAIALAVSIVVGGLAAMNGAGEWQGYLKYLHGVPFGIKDPLYQQDIGFYVFRLPFLKTIFAWLLVACLVSGIAVVLLYFIRRSFLFLPPRHWRMAAVARGHLSAIGAALCLVMAFGFWIQLYDLLFVKRGVVFGPGYTDVTTQIGVMKALIGVSVLAAAAFIVSIFKGNWRIPFYTVGAFIALVIVGRGLYPGMVQKFKVVPNEVVLERPYLEKNIQYTRMAYKLDDIEVRQFKASENLTLADLKRNEATIKNIRLWDHEPLLSTYSQLQEIRTYYKFPDVDNDRYLINGSYRQVALALRELSYPSLPSRTWVNEHMTYSHGYGLVMSPVNRITKEGLPEFFIKDIPPVSNIDIKITRPEIYYGETSNEYVFVKGKRPEFDYPVGDKNVYSRYEGKGGVPLTFWRKLLYAIRFGSFTMLLSDDITPETRIMYYRDIKDRVSRIAPFIYLDDDAYPVVTPAGRIVWIIDAYTVTDRFPYSEPIRGVGNYIRNAVKAVVDAYDGTVTLYVSDPSDPIIRTYSRIFPGVFRDLADMPEALRAHIRYPQDMFGIQASMYRAYHMQDPQVFYNKEDLWSIPSRTLQGADKPMEPYYTILKFPEDKKEEFIVMIPFTPSKRDNMSAWMAARCDAPNYGKLIVYNFPKQSLVYGPRQIEARIDQDTEISKQLSLWNQRGSQVIRGSLLAIPVDQSILYVESLYLAAERGRMPELKRVILSFGNAIAMEENLEQSMQRIFGGELLKERIEGLKAGATPAPVVKTDRGLAIEALDHYRKAQDYIRQGNWAGYGEEIKRLGDVLKALEGKN